MDTALSCIQVRWYYERMIADSCTYLTDVRMIFEIKGADFQILIGLNAVSACSTQRENVPEMRN
jgi:hypothetical protein